MNRNQKIVIIVGLIGIVVRWLFPPWRYTYQGITIMQGYSFFLNPLTESANVDLSRLLVQGVGVCIVVAGVVLVLKDKDEK